MEIVFNIIINLLFLGIMMGIGLLIGQITKLFIKNRFSERLHSWQEIAEFILIVAFILSYAYPVATREPILRVQTLSEILYFAIFIVISVLYIILKVIFRQKVRLANQDNINLLRMGGLSYFIYIVWIPLLIVTDTDPYPSSPNSYLFYLSLFAYLILPYFKLVNILENPRFRNILSGYIIIIALVLDLTLKNGFITFTAFAISFAISYFSNHMLTLKPGKKKEKAAVRI